MGASSPLREPRTTPPPAHPELASAVVSRRLRDAAEAAADAGGVKPAILAFLDALNAPIDLTPEEARAAAYVAGQQRMALDLEDPELATAQILRGPLILSTESFFGIIRPGASRDGLRRTLQELRDDGILEHVGRGLWRPVFDEEAEIRWPGSDRKQGWVIDKNGNGYAI